VDGAVVDGDGAIDNAIDRIADGTTAQSHTVHPVTAQQTTTEVKLSANNLSVLLGNSTTKCTICDKFCSGSKLLEFAKIQIVKSDAIEKLRQSEQNCSALVFFKSEMGWTIGGVEKSCVFCPLTFSSHYQICQHLVTAHEKISITFIPLITEKKYFCGICTLFFVERLFRQHFQSHLNRGHKVQVYVEGNGI
jgi:hypothetical protein